MDIRLDIVGMTCSHCTSTVERALKKIPGASNVIVDLDSAGAMVTLENTPDIDKKIAELCAAVEDVGFDASLSVPSPANVIILHVTGMTCGHCTATVERALKAVPRIANATVDLESATATITIVNPAGLTEHPDVALAAVDAVEAVGFDASIAGPASQNESSSEGAQTLELAPSADAKQRTLLTTSSASRAQPADVSTLKLHVATMHCRSCERWVTDAVSAVPGVSRVAVNLAESSVEMAVAARETQTVAEALATAGYTATLWADYLREGASSGNALNSTSSDNNGGEGSSDISAAGAGSATPERDRAVVLAVGGMTCAACASRVETALAKVPGVADVIVNFLTGRVVVRLALPSQPPPSPSSRSSSPRPASSPRTPASPASPSTTWRASAMESGLLEPISPDVAPSKSYQSIGHEKEPSPAPLPTATELADVVIDVGYTAVAVSGGGGSGAGGGAGGGVDGNSSAASCALEVEGLVCDACPARVVKALEAMHGATACTLDMRRKGTASSSSFHGSPTANGEWQEAGHAVVHLAWDTEVPNCGARTAIATITALGYAAKLAESGPDGTILETALDFVCRRSISHEKVLNYELLASSPLYKS